MRILTPIFILIVLTACESRRKPKEIEWQTMEIFTINGRPDTLNRVDGSGRKQGKWIPSPMNDLRDTVYYVNDSLVKGSISIK